MRVGVLDNGLRVTRQATQYSATYSRNICSHMLEAHEFLARPGIDGAGAPFLAAAWKAAYAKAKELGWL